MPAQLCARLRQWAEDFIQSPASFINPSTGPEPAFASPLLGAASGADPLWLEFKKPKIIGPFHWTPVEAFNLAFPREKTEAGELSVLCWICAKHMAH